MLLSFIVSFGKNGNALIFERVHLFSEQVRLDHQLFMLLASIIVPVGSFSLFLHFFILG